MAIRPIASAGPIVSPELALVDAVLAAELRLSLPSVEDSWLAPGTSFTAAAVATEEDMPSSEYVRLPALEPEGQAIQETEAALRRLRERLSDGSLARRLALDSL